MSDKFAVTTAEGSNLTRIHALSSALAAHFASNYTSKGTARVQFAVFRTALMGGTVQPGEAQTVAEVLEAAGEGWESFATVDELSGKGRTFGYLSALDSRDVFTGKGEGSLSHLFKTLLMADLAGMPEWVALPDRAPTRVTGQKGGAGLPATYDFATAGISDALLTIARYTANNDVEFIARHGVAHVKAGNKYVGSINSNGDQLAPIKDFEGQEIKGAKQLTAQKNEAALIFAAKNYGKLKKATQGATARKVGEFLMDCAVGYLDTTKAVGAARVVWQHCPPALRTASLAALQKDGPADPSYIAGLEGIKILS